MPKLRFQWNSVPKLTVGAEVYRLVSKVFRAEVTRVEHRLALLKFLLLVLAQAEKKIDKLLFQKWFQLFCIFLFFEKEKSFKVLSDFVICWPNDRLVSKHNISVLNQINILRMSETS